MRCSTRTAVDFRMLVFSNVAHRIEGRTVSRNKKVKRELKSMGQVSILRQGSKKRESNHHVARGLPGALRDAYLKRTNAISLCVGLIFEK